MKKLTLSISCALILLNSICFAEWRKCPDYDETQKVEDFMYTIDREFLIPVEPSKTGFIIHAMAEDLSSSVQLRYNKDEVDFKVSIYKIRYAKDAQLSMILLDEDRFSLGEVFISNISQDFTGTLYGNFKNNCEWKKFSKIKYYKFTAREAM